MPHMPSSDETVTLDPVEFAIARAELELDGLGLYVVDAEYGDSEIELFLVKQRLGEIPSNKRPPNREVKIKIGVKEDGELDLASAATMLQQKIGRMQDEGGFLKRTPDTRSGASPVVFQVFGAAIGGLHGWYMAHRQHAPNVELRFNTGPYCYGLNPVEAESFTDSTHRQLIFTLPDVQGTAPGLARYRLKNEGTGSWRGLVIAGESRDYTEGSTAELAYDCEKLDLLGLSEEHTRTGASGGKTVKAVLNEEWLGLIGSKIGGITDMTHKGVRRLYFRVFDPNAEAGTISLRLEYRANGASKWSQNEIVKTKLRGNFDILDLGECRPKEAILGDRIWEWRLTGMTSENGNSIEIDCVWIYPTEMFTRVSENPVITVPSSFEALDSFETDEVAATGTAPFIGPGVYQESSGSDATDFVIKEDCLRREAANDSGSTAGFKGRGIGLDVNMSELMFQYDLIGEFESGSEMNSFNWGQLLKYTDNNNYVAVYFEAFIFAPFETWQLKMRVKKGGVTTSTFLGLYTTPHLDNIHTPQGRLLSELSGDVVTTWFSADTRLYPMEVIGTHQDAAIAELAAGDVYILDSCAGSAESQRNYKKLALWTPEDEAVAFADRFVEVRTEGAFRQMADQDVWGELIPDRGALPDAYPSGLEDRPFRAIAVPTRGDFELTPDAGSNPLSGQMIYYPGYHFMSEAT